MSCGEVRRLGSGVAVAMVKASGYSSDEPPYAMGVALKKKKKKKDWRATAHACLLISGFKYQRTDSQNVEVCTWSKMDLTLI